MRTTVQARQTVSVSVPETGGVLTNLATSSSSVSYAGTADGALAGTSLAPGASVALNGTVYVYAPDRAELDMSPSPLVGSSSGGVASYTATVNAASGTAGTDTAAIQAKLDAASAAGGGTVILKEGTYVINAPLLVDTHVVLKGQGRGTVIQLANGANCDAIQTKTFTANTGGSALAGEHDFGVQDLVLDGNRANQTATSHGIRIYGRAYRCSNLVIRNFKGRAFHSEDTSQSTSTGMENSMPAVLENFMFRTCDGEGIYHRGPHDSHISNGFLFETMMGNTGSKAQLNVPSDGYSNGTAFSLLHLWGGYSDYGVYLASSGLRMYNSVVEGGLVAQVWNDASQNQFEKCHFYTGGVNTATAKGMVLGHSGGVISGTDLDCVFENCGGGAIDFTYGGDQNTIRFRHYYFTGTAPSGSTLGIIGFPSTSKNRFDVQVIDNTFTPTSASLSQLQGSTRIAKANSSDTRDLLRLMDEATADMFVFDKWGRPIAKAGTPTTAVGAQQGSGASAATITGFDAAGTISITTGTTPAAGQLAAVTFAHVFGTTPNVVITPKDAGAAALQPFVTTAASGFSVRCATAPAASTTYAFDYVVVGKTS